MEFIPVEVLVMILGYLRLSDILVCRLVSKYLNGVIQAKALQKKTWFCNKGKSVFDMGLEAVVKHSMTSVTKLYLSRVHLTEDSLGKEDTKNFFSRLTALELNLVHAQENAIGCILKQCSSLKYLRLSSVTFESFLSNEEDLDILKISLANVTNLDLSYQTLSYSQFTKLTSCIVNLENFIVDYTFIDSDAEALSQFIIRRGQKFKSCKISGMKNSIHTIQALAKMENPNLTELQIIFPETENTHTHEEFYEAFFNLLSCYRFQSLHLGYMDPEWLLDGRCFMEMKFVTKLTLICLSITSWKECLSYLISLKALTLEAIEVSQDSDFLEGIKESNMNATLKCLCLNKNLLDPKVLLELFPLIPNLEQLKLQENIINTAENEDDFQYAQMVMDQILLHLRKLRQLNIRSCHGAKQMFLLSQNQTQKAKDVLAEFQQTDILCLPFQWLLSDDSLDMYQKEIKKLQRSLPQPEHKMKLIEVLELTCTGVDDLSMLLATKFDCLREVRLEMAELQENAITDLGFIALGQNNPSLEEIDLRKCNITNFGLLGMLQNTPRLRKLKLHLCNSITTDSVSQIPTICPELKDIKVHKLKLCMIE